MNKALRKILSFTVRWGIAVVGIGWVLAQMSIADQTLILDEQSRPRQMIVLDQPSAGQFLLQDPQTQQTQVRPAGELLSKPDRKKVMVSEEGGPRELSLLAMDLRADDESRPEAQRLLVADSPEAPARWIAPEQVVGGFVLTVPHPRVEIGIGRMVKNADLSLLILSVLIFPLTIMLTSIRWQKLLAALDIPMSLGRTTVLNMVGLFYNTCVPMGSSGGDLLKAYYAAKHTPHKMRAILSVVIDRVIGLIVLIMVGSTIAGAFWLMADDKLDPAVRACGYVALIGAVILASTALAVLIGFHPWVKGMLLSERFLSRVPMRAQVQSVFEVMGIYRQRPGLIIWAMAMTVPVHLNVVVSALLAGKSFGLPLTSGYYFVVVPVTVLVGAIPISPQGVGVMEFFAINLTARQGATISQAFALTMSIRLVQMLWNMVGGVFVVTGHYRAPDRAELEAAPANGA